MRKINRRNFLKAAGILSAAVAGSLMTGCGGSDAGTQAAASNLTPYNELTVGTDHTDLTATIKVINHRTEGHQPPHRPDPGRHLRRLCGRVPEAVPQHHHRVRMLYIKWLTESSNFAYDQGGVPVLKSQEYPDTLAAFDGIELLEDTTAPDELADLAVNVQQEAELMLNADQTHVMRIVEAGINGDETIDDIVADWNEAWNRGVERYAPEA